MCKYEGVCASMRVCVCVCVSMRYCVYNKRLCDNVVCPCVHVVYVNMQYLLPYTDLLRQRILTEFSHCLSELQQRIVESINCLLNFLPKWFAILKRKKKIRRGHPDLNQGPLDLQSNALPLSYTPNLRDYRYMYCSGWT